MCAMKRESESVSASSAASSRGRNSDPDSAVDARTDGVSLLPRMRVWICSGAHEGVFGDGKWRLLNAIEKTQSLAAAAESLRMSYRKAWGDIRKAERTLGVALVTRHRGGSEGGSTELTDGGPALDTTLLGLSQAGRGRYASRVRRVYEGTAIESWRLT